MKRMGKNDGENKLACVQAGKTATAASVPKLPELLQQA
jgi:hypothetical protein